MGHSPAGNDRFLDTLQDYLTLQQVAREFGLRMRGYRSQGNSSVIETDEGPKEVRRLRHSLDEYKFACLAAEFLRGQGFTRLPRATWAPSGSPIVAVDGAYYTMHDWVPGTRADLDNLCQLVQAVEMLAWFHRCAQGFKPIESPPVRAEWGSWPRRFATVIEEMYRFEDRARAEGQDDRFLRHFLRYFEEFITQASSALQDLEASPYDRVIRAEREAGGLCHGDFEGRNLVLRDDGALYLTDFDDLAMDTRLEDLGRFLLRHGRWDLERFLFILHVYRGVAPLDHDQVECLCAYLRFPHELWSAVNDRFAGKEGDRKALKRLAANMAQRNQLVDALRRSDLSFLAGASPLYNMGFAGLPEVPAGKQWSIASWPAADAETQAAVDHEWWLPGSIDEPGSELMTAPSGGQEEPGTVLEEGEAAGTIWPQAMPELMGMMHFGREATLQAEAAEAYPAESGIMAEPPLPVAPEAGESGAGGSLEPEMAEHRAEPAEPAEVQDSAPPETPAPAPQPQRLIWSRFPAPLRRPANDRPHG